MQQICVAYIVDLVQVLKILIALIGGEKALTRRPIKFAFNTYNNSLFRRYIHIEVKHFTPSVRGHDVMLEKMESLLRINHKPFQLPTRASNRDLDEDEPWDT